MRPIVALVALGALAVLMPASPAAAHAPHDVISDVAVSPDLAAGETLMTIARGRLMRSTDGGRSWTVVVNGIDNDGGLTEVEISPADPSIAYVAAGEGEGVYRSGDGGLSWNRTTKEIETPEISLLVASPDSARTAFAAGEGVGLIRTVDAGRTWESLVTTGGVTALAYSAVDSSRILRGTAAGALEESTDGGASWRTLASSPGDAITAVAGSGDGNVLVATADGRLLRHESGTNVLRELPFEDRVASLVASGSDVWAVGAERGPFLSTDAGDTWERRAEGVTSHEQSDTPPTDVADFTRLAVAADGRLYVGGWDGLFRSDDEGLNWWELQTLDGFIVGLALSPDFASDATIAVSTYVNGAYISFDGGRSWGEAGTELRLDAGRFSSRLYNLVFSPAFAGDQTLFSSTNLHFLRSEDAGETWTEVELGHLEPDPKGNRVDIVAVSPAYATDRAVFVGTTQGSILRSSDAGETFSALARLEGSVRSLVLSPTFAHDQTMFASLGPSEDAGSPGAAAGVYKSTDGGLTWDRLEFTGYGPLAISPAFADDATLFAGQRRAIYASRDGGATWTKSVVPGWGMGPLEALAVSPTFAGDGIALASVRGKGLYRSMDGGQTFDQVAADPIEENHLVADFDKPTAAPIQFSPAFAEDHTIYAFAARDLLESTDDGETWRVVNRPTTPILPATAAGSGGGGGLLPAGLVVTAIVVLLVGATIVLRRRRSSASAPPSDPEQPRIA